VASRWDSRSTGVKVIDGRYRDHHITHHCTTVLHAIPNLSTNIGDGLDEAEKKTATWLKELRISSVDLTIALRFPCEGRRKIKMF
jgi:hypothetical protein